MNTCAKEQFHLFLWAQPCGRERAREREESSLPELETLMSTSP